MCHFIRKKNGPIETVIFYTRDMSGKKMFLSFPEILNHYSIDEIIELRKKYPEIKEEENIDD